MTGKKVENNFTFIALYFVESFLMRIILYLTNKSFF